MIFNIYAHGCHVEIVGIPNQVRQASVCSFGKHAPRSLIASSSTCRSEAPYVVLMIINGLNNVTPKLPAVPVEPAKFTLSTLRTPVSPACKDRTVTHVP